MRLREESVCVKRCRSVSVIYGKIGWGVNQAYSQLSLTASWIRWCMQVYACELMWTCLV